MDLSTRRRGTATVKRRLTPVRRAVARLAVLGVALASATGCSPARLLDLFVPDEGYVVERGIRYGPLPRQRLDIYRPVVRAAGGDQPLPAPVLVFFYGGSWKSGQREYYRFIGEAFATQGYVVVIPDYRLYPDVLFPTFVEDGADAVRWVVDSVDRYGGDPRSIALLGHSAGAHIAALLALDPRYLEAAAVDRSRIRAFVGYAGPYAFNPLAYDSTRPIFATIDHPEQAKPIAYVGTVQPPPMLLLHGADDSTVKPVNSEALAEQIERSGNRADFAEIPERGHIGLVVSLAAPFRGRDQVYDLTLAFIADAFAPPRQAP